MFVELSLSTMLYDSLKRILPDVVGVPVGVDNDLGGSDGNGAVLVVSV